MAGDTYLTSEARAILARVWRLCRTLQARAAARAKSDGMPVDFAARWGIVSVNMDDMTAGRSSPANVDPAAWYEVCREELSREAGR